MCAEPPWQEGDGHQGHQGELWEATKCPLDMSELVTQGRGGVVDEKAQHVRRQTTSSAENLQAHCGQVGGECVRRNNRGG